MVQPTIVVRNGKRYVKVKNAKGKTTLVSVAKGISERELIQWLIKHFKPKRRKVKKSTKSKIELPPMVATVITNDQERVDARNVKAMLDETKKELDQIKLAQAIVNAGAGISQPALPSVVLPAIAPPTPLATPPLSRSSSSSSVQPKNLTQTQIKQGIVSLTKLAADQNAAETKLTGLQDQLAKMKQNRADALSETEIKKMLSAKGGPMLRTLATGYKTISANPKSKEIVDKLWNEAKDPLGVNVYRNSVNTKYDNLESSKQQEIDAAQISLDDITEKLVNLKKQAGNGSLRQEQDKGTSEDQLNQAMQDFPEFLGVIAVNEMPTLLNKIGQKKRICWIMNVDPKSKPGSHWVCFLVDARDNGSHSVEYYNPLADPISDLPKHVMSDLKRIVKEIHGQKTYLKFKTNLITDQSDTSNNCGEFCVHFLQARLDGEPFSKASGWDAAGEKNIELWKVGKPWLAPKKPLWISGQMDEINLRDADLPVRRNATRILQRIKDTLNR